MQSFPCEKRADLRKNEFFCSTTILGKVLASYVCPAPRETTKILLDSDVPLHNVLEAHMYILAYSALGFSRTAQSRGFLRCYAQLTRTGQQIISIISHSFSVRFNGSSEKSYSDFSKMKRVALRKLLSQSWVLSAGFSSFSLIVQLWLMKVAAILRCAYAKYNAFSCM